MTRQPDSIDAKEMNTATATTGVADSVPLIEKFQLLVGKPSSLSLSVLNDIKIFTANIFSCLQPGGLDDPPPWCFGNSHGCGGSQVGFHTWGGGWAQSLRGYIMHIIKRVDRQIFAIKEE